MLRAWADILVGPEQWERDMRFGTWNVRSRYRAGSMTAAASELARYKLHLLGVQEVRWDREGTVRRGVSIFCMEKERKIRSIYTVSQEEWTKLRESVPYVELYRYNSKHLYPKLNGYGDNGQRKVWTSCISMYCTSTAVAH